MGGPNFLFARGLGGGGGGGFGGGGGGGGMPFSSIKPSLTNHVNSRIADGKIISCVYANFSHFYLVIFHLRILSVQVSTQTVKKVFTIV